MEKSSSKRKKSPSGEKVTDKYMPVSSSGDCTGLIPADGDPSPAEIDSYEEMYPFTVPKMPDKKDDERDMERARRFNRF